MASEPAQRVNFWDSEAGKQVEKRLRAWCEKELHGGMAATGNGNGVQGKPGDLPAGWCLAMDVDITLREWGAGKLEAMILHVYGAGARPTTVEHGGLDLWIERFFLEERSDIDQGRTFERVKGKLVAMMLYEFGIFMAKQRGL